MNTQTHTHAHTLRAHNQLTQCRNWSLPNAPFDDIVYQYAYECLPIIRNLQNDGNKEYSQKKIVKIMIE